MELKIESKILKDYLEVITVNGNVNEMLLNFTEEGVTANNTLEGNIGATFSFLKKEVFRQYNNELNSIGIKDTNILINIVNSFEGLLNIRITENVFTIYNETKTANIILMKPEFITTVFPEEPKNKLMSKFEDDVEMSLDIFKKAVSNSNILKSDSFSLELKDNVLTITTGENSFDTIEEKVNLTYKDFNLKLGSTFKSIMNILPSNVKFSVLGNNSPCMFKIKNDNYDCKVMLAPVIDED